MIIIKNHLIRLIGMKEIIIEIMEVHLVGKMEELKIIII